MQRNVRRAVALVLVTGTLAVAGMAGVAVAAGAATDDGLPAWTGGHECVECHAAQDPAALESAAPDPAALGAADAADAKKPAEGARAVSKPVEKAGAAEDAARDAAPLMALHTALDCQLCHPDNDDMDYAHWGAKVDSPAPLKLKYSKVNPAVCLACHKGDAAPATTADVDALTDTAGLAVNPHDLPDPNGSHASVVCSDCHLMHAASDAGEAAYGRCIDCHHVEVWGCACHDE